MIIKLAFMTSIFMYGAVLHLLSQQPLTSAFPEIGLIAQIMAVFYAAMVVFVAPVISARVVARTGTYTQGVMVLRLAIYEMGAIFGFVLTRFSNDMHYYYYFGGVAFLLMLTVPASNLNPSRRG